MSGVAPLVTLTTDFGSSSYYVGAMKGVLHSLCPGVQTVDITHEINPFSPLEASFVLAQACPRFPAETVHLAVVDPGVGSHRAPLIVRSGGAWFVGPDNGVFTPFLEKAEGRYRIRPEVGREPSATFEGRDLFAPAAARLAGGEPVTDLARPVSQVVRLHLPRPRRDGIHLVGRVLTIDRFGNCISNIHREDLPASMTGTSVRVGTYRIPGLSRSYHEGAVGEALALVGSSGYLEVAVVQGNAAAQLGVGRGEQVEITVPEGAWI